MITVDKKPFRGRLPDFLKQTIPHGSALHNVQKTIKDFGLNTVCEEAKCPNRTHCYARGTLTFQILGKICTRACGFCAETVGKPPLGQDISEPRRVVDAARRLHLKHVVVTSPARDDMADEGAGAFKAVVETFRQDLPAVTVELLTPDFSGRPECLETVFNSRPDIFNHNIETVRRLTPKVRSRATYDRTLYVLKSAYQASLKTKSGIMVGHGENFEELLETFRDLKDSGCSLLTIGQYLPPTPRHLPLVRIYQPKEFDELKVEALKMGFLDVASGPLVRSSYHADELVPSFPPATAGRPSSPNVFVGDPDCFKIDSRQKQSGMTEREWIPDKDIRE